MVKWALDRTGRYEVREVNDSTRAWKRLASSSRI